MLTSTITVMITTVMITLATITLATITKRTPMVPGRRRKAIRTGTITATTTVIRTA